MKEDKIKSSFAKVKQDVFDLQSQILSISQDIKELKRTLNQTQNQTDRQTNQTDRQTRQTAPQEEEELKPQNLPISTGNEGVQTDRQTNQQTDKPADKVRLNNNFNDKITKIQKVSEILDSLDSLKKDLRSQFKRITRQEMLVFSTIYQLDEEGLSVDYSLLSQKTNLTESSIRDYIQKLIKKNIPVEKFKENNKKVILKISPNFKKIASLDTILTLREL